MTIIRSSQLTEILMSFDSQTPADEEPNNPFNQFPKETQEEIKKFMNDFKMETAQYYRRFHECLLLSDRSNWSPAVEEDFGPFVELTDFDEWYAATKELFESMQMLREDGDVQPEVYAELVAKIDGPLDESAIMAAVREKTADGELLVRVSLHDKTMKQTVAAFKSILRAHGNYMRSYNKPLGEQWGKYQLQKRPDTNTLDCIIKVHKARKADPKKSLYELGIECGVVQHDHIVREGDNEHTIRGKKMVVNAAVSRYVRRGKTLIEGVQKGLFPVYD